MDSIIEYYDPDKNVFAFDPQTFFRNSFPFTKRFDTYTDLDLETCGRFYDTFYLN